MRTFLSLLLIGPTLAAAAPVRDHHVVAELVPEQDAIVPGKTLTVCFNIKHDDKWHTYWKNPGIAGVPIKLDWDLPEGFEAGPIQWARPQRVKMAIYNTFGYEGEVTLLIDIKTPANLEPGTEVELKATSFWMMCADTCHPSSAKFSVTVPVATSSQPHSRGKRLADETRKTMPKENRRWDTSATLGEKTGTLTLTRRESTGDVADPDKLYLFCSEGLIDSHPEQKVERLRPGVFRMTLPRAEFGPKNPTEIRGVLLSTTGTETEAISIRAKLSKSPK